VNEGIARSMAFRENLCISVGFLPGCRELLFHPKSNGLLKNPIPLSLLLAGLIRLKLMTSGLTNVPKFTPSHDSNQVKHDQN
jgi:hypothetical protein